jgi:outer membrane protein OmpA-like peptidoglycan-associated protein
MIPDRLSILFAALAAAGLAHAAAPSVPATPQAWAARMLDTTQNGSAFKDPAVFRAWVDAMMNPATSMALMQQGMDPNAYARMAAAMMNPATLQNYVQFVDPAVYARWMQAAMNPAFYNALMAQAMNPANYMHWMALPVNPQMWNQGMQMLNPALYMNWMGAPLNPAMVQAMTAPANPELYGKWMGTALNPRTYGPWGALMTMPAAVPPAPPQATGKTPESPAAAAEAIAKPAEAPAEAAEAPGQAEETPAGAEAAPAAPPAAQAAAGTTTSTVLAADSLFKLDRSGVQDMSGEARARLDDIANKIKALGGDVQVRIIGHADATGSHARNRRLSKARARSVKSYLVAKGVKPGVITTSGRGDTQPVVQCDMSQPRDQLVQCLAPNRRVEIEVVGKAP